MTIKTMLESEFMDLWWGKNGHTGKDIDAVRTAYEHGWLSDIPHEVRMVTKKDILEWWDDYWKDGKVVHACTDVAIQDFARSHGILIEKPKKECKHITRGIIRGMCVEDLKHCPDCGADLREGK